MSTMAFQPGGQREDEIKRSQRDADLEKMIVAQAHIGTENIDFGMTRYIYKRNAAGYNIFDLNKTYEKLMVAARILVTIENPADIVVVSARPFGSRAILKFAHFTGAQAVAGRWMPGTFTNQITKKFMEPRLLLVTDPYTDAQAVKECFYANIPVIAFCNSDSPLNYIDVVIPCNNKGIKSIAVMYWLLAREILHLRGQLPRDLPWSVKPDLFLHKEVDYKAIMNRDKQQEQATAPTAPHEGSFGAPLTRENDLMQPAPADTWNSVSADRWAGGPIPATGGDWGGH